MTSFRRPPRKLGAYSSKLIQALHATSDKHRVEDRVLRGHRDIVVMPEEDLRAKYLRRPLIVSDFFEDYLDRAG